MRLEAGRADNAAGMMELRVPTVALAAEVTCADGRTFTGRIFVPAAASHHSGPMRPEEWINEPLPYFPFLPDDAAVPVMLNKHTVLVVTLQVGESSLYPALQRLLLRGWAKAEWGASENNRRARYYTLTAAGRKQLAVERQEFDRLILAIHKVLNTA